VLLHNDNVLFGAASQLGEYVIVRRGAGNEIRLPRQQVACWADSLRDLYRYRVDHRENRDLASLLKDARWCIRYDLFDLARQEISSVFALDPINQEAQRLASQIERIVSPPRPKIRSQLETSVQSVTYQDPQGDLGGVDLVGLRGFASGVQPMLVNRCGRCHSHTSGRTWILLTPSPGARATARMTRENIAASLRFIDPHTPHNSQLLIKAVTPHGGGPAPLNVRQSKAIEALQNWVSAVTATLASRQPARENRSPGVEPSSGQSSAQPSFESWLVDRDATADPVGYVNGAVQTDTPARLPQVDNPFDPALFNRRYHPE
jgi:hypothetical protein